MDNKTKQILKYILLIILVIIILILIFKEAEYLDNLSTPLENKNIGLKIEYQKSGTESFDDKLFDDVVLYESDPADATKSGVFTCLEKCKGSCLEYGITGNTFCFPNK